MPRRVDDDDDRASWDNAKTAAEVRAVLAAFDDVPPIDDAVRLTLQRWLYRQDKFFGDVNRDALIEPILCAVSWVKDPAFAKHGLALLDAFDQVKLTELLATMRGLDVLSEKSISSYLSIAIRNRVTKILEPAEAKPAKATKVKLPPKPPLSVTRVAQIEKAISLGKDLLSLRASIACNKQFGRERRRRFPDVDIITAARTMRVARLYGDLHKIWRAASWRTLIELASPKMAPSMRQEFEARILAGESITAPHIRKIRGRFKGGSPKRPIQQPAPRMAA